MSNFETDWLYIHWASNLTYLITFMTSARFNWIHEPNYQRFSNRHSSREKKKSPLFMQKIGISFSPIVRGNLLFCCKFLYDQIFLKFYFHGGSLPSWKRNPPHQQWAYCFWNGLDTTTSHLYSPFWYSISYIPTILTIKKV